MANRTVKDAKSVHGTNPQYLIEKIIRCRIYDSKYWKEECFALTSELLVDKAMQLKCIGGIHGASILPTPFLCLVLKMLQIQPEKEIVVEFIKNEEFKYVRALGAFYMRLTGSSTDCYKYLEPLYNDNRKLQRQKRDSHNEIVHMDEFIDELLREESVCDIILPRIQKRYVLEENNELEPKVSALDDDLEDEIHSEDEKDISGKKENHKPSRSEKAKRPRYKDEDRRPRERDHKRDVKEKKNRSRSRSRGRDKERNQKTKEKREHYHRDTERRDERRRRDERKRY